MSLQAARYELPLARPLQLGAELVHVRRGWLLRRGNAVGDACPLPGFSVDRLEDVDTALADGGSTPSMEWARHTLELEGEASVPTAGLVVAPGGAEEPVSACVKCKVGRQPLEIELAAVARLRACGVRLRLDGNRSLSLEHAQRLAEAAGDALEFLEEPVAPGDLATALRTMPVALDESLVGGGEVPDGARAFVLKPTILGAARTLELVDMARRAGTPVVISSSYESAVGRAALIRFAAEVAPDVHHGLGTGPAFAEDFTGWVRADGERLIASQGLLPQELAWVAC